MPVIWTEYRCPHCGHKLSDSNIAEIHFNRKCQYCNSRIYINGHEALTKTSTASFFAAIAIAISVAIWVTMINVIGSYIKAGVFGQFPEIFMYILTVICLGLSGGFAVAITKRYKNFMLKKEI